MDHIWDNGSFVFLSILSRELVDACFNSALKFISWLHLSMISSYFWNKSRLTLKNIYLIEKKKHTSVTAIWLISMEFLTSEIVVNDSMSWTALEDRNSTKNPVARKSTFKSLWLRSFLSRKFIYSYYFPYLITNWHIFVYVITLAIGWAKIIGFICTTSDKLS